LVQDFVAETRKAKHERRRKKVQLLKKRLIDNLSLLTAIFAAAFAGWAAFEAHETRVHSDEIAIKSLKVAQDSLTVQKQSVDSQLASLNAQISAMKLDEMPFVNIKPLYWTVDYQRKIAHIAYSVVSLGKTPAFDLYLSDACAAMPAFGEPSLHPESNPLILVSGLALDLTKTLNCHARFTEHDNEVKLLINLEYDDYFKGHHTSTFCFRGYASLHTDKPLQLALLECQKPKPNNTAASN